MFISGASHYKWTLYRYFLTYPYISFPSTLSNPPPLLPTSICLLSSSSFPLPSSPLLFLFLPFLPLFFHVLLFLFLIFLLLTLPFLFSFPPFSFSQFPSLYFLPSAFSRWMQTWLLLYQVKVYSDNYPALRSQQQFLKSLYLMMVWKFDLWQPGNWNSWMSLHSSYFLY